jgi:CheY-like chemotaxis protein
MRGIPMAHEVTLLFVEDKQDVRRTVKALLAMAFPTIRFVGAADGIEALERIQQQTPDLVITDIDLPRMDGLDLLRTLQKTHPTLPVVVCSGHGDEYVRRRAVDYGAAAFLLKPLALNDLRATITQWTAITRAAGVVPTQKPVRCVLSYSHKDEEFCDRLCDQLQASGVDVWYSSRSVLAGEKIRDQIERAISERQNLIVVLSENSVASDWVGSEIIRAKAIETSTSRRVLFPIRLIGIEELKRWSLFDSDSGRDIAREIREYFIPDFTNWRDPDSFERTYLSLLRSLEMRDRV